MVGAEFVQRLTRPALGAGAAALLVEAGVRRVGSCLEMGPVLRATESPSDTPTVARSVSPSLNHPPLLFLKANRSCQMPAPTLTGGHCLLISVPDDAAVEDSSEIL